MGLRRDAMVERDGVRVTIELERNPMPGGELVAIDTEVTNVGRDVMTWFHGGCAIAVNVSAMVEGRKWRHGRVITGAGGRFKNLALAGLGIEDGQVRIDFRPARWLDRGTVGCTDMGIGDVLAPGASVRQQLAWDGLASRRLLPPPAGPVALRGTFDSYWRGPAALDEEHDLKTIDVDLPAWIEGSPVGLLHPGEGVDVAVTEARFLAVIERRDLGNANEPLLRFDPATSTWEVGLLDHAVRRLQSVVLDARTGEILRFVDRPWDFDREGVP